MGQHEKDLSFYETRVIGVLMERKSRPRINIPFSQRSDGGCNQKSNRHPVLELE